jgi:transcriptional regulator with XRE-family HTH domain
MRNRVRDLRGEQGWSQADLAERLDVSRQTVKRNSSRWVSGSPTTIAAISFCSAGYSARSAKCSTSIAGLMPGRARHRSTSSASRPTPGLSRRRNR